MARPGFVLDVDSSTPPILFHHGEGFRRALPVADPAQVRAHTKVVLARHRGELALVLLLHALAAVAALASPWLIGRLIDALNEGTTTAVVNRFVAGLIASVLAATGLTWAARRASFILGEGVFADLREEFIERATRLPLSILERAGTGDLVAN